MDGNQNSCTNCKQTIKEEQFYKCDLCIQSIHKNCASLSASEIKCMPLQKRLLILLCNECRELLAKTPLMLKQMEEIKTEIKSLMTEIKSLKNDTDRYNTKGLENNLYAQVLRNRSEKYEENKGGLPSLIIKPKQKQKSEKTKKDLRNQIQPSQLKIGIKNMRETKQGGMVIKCSEKEDIKLLKQAAEDCLGKDYDIELPKLNLPKIKIVGYSGDKSPEELEDIIKQQNKWIEHKDKLKINYIRKNRGKHTSTIYSECSPELYWKMMDHKKLFIGWERCIVYENLAVTKCFKCQGYFHKSNNCENEISCEHCAGNHERKSCTTQIKKCKNCEIANIKYKLGHNVNHTASDPECPSTKYHLNLIRSKTDYGGF